MGGLKKFVHVLCLTAEGTLRFITFAVTQSISLGRIAREAARTRLASSPAASTAVRRIAALARNVSGSIRELSLQARPHFARAWSWLLRSLEALAVVAHAWLQKASRVPAAIQEIRHPEDPSEAEIGASSTPNERLIRSLLDSAEAAKMTAAQWAQGLPAKAAQLSRSAYAQALRCEPTVARVAAKSRAGLKKYPQLDAFLGRSAQVLALVGAWLLSQGSALAKQSRPFLIAALDRLRQWGDKIASWMARSPIGSMATLTAFSLCLLLIVSKSSAVFAEDATQTSAPDLIAIDLEPSAAESGRWIADEADMLVAVETRPQPRAEARASTRREEKRRQETVREPRVKETPIVEGHRRDDSPRVIRRVSVVRRHRPDRAQ